MIQKVVVTCVWVKPANYKPGDQISFHTFQANLDIRHSHADYVQACAQALGCPVQQVKQVNRSTWFVTGDYKFLQLPNYGPNWPFDQEVIINKPKQ